MQRREFVGGVAVTSLLGSSAFCAGSTESKFRVGVIGHTGRGDYGHGLDTVWKRVAETQIVAVADGNEKGLAKAKEKTGALNGYTDYRKMLTEQRPDIVAVCPRHPDQHAEMAIAAAQAGAKGIYCEKPFVRTPAEADAVIAACEKHGTKLAVAHRNRYHPAMKTIGKLIAGKAIGRILEIRGRGKGDRRGGGEDLWVLGCHIFNMINYFAGAPSSCSAVMLQGGRDVVAADVRPGNEALGPLAGNEIHARYEMERGIIAYFDSIANDGTKNQGFGLQIVGSEGRILVQADLNPVAYLQRGNPFSPARPNAWEPITSDGVGESNVDDVSFDLVSHHVTAAQDLVSAIGSNRAPLCDATQGRTTVEMICAVFDSHRRGGRAVSFPLEERGNPLRKF
ncbi:Gfo/Idh/MocA family oxidoreductase [Pirellulaceae bacterium]|nr:Gfo/Idh/MocA family oxidoreductase [Pirellulaceae bacterium]